MMGCKVSFLLLVCFVLGSRAGNYEEALDKLTPDEKNVANALRDVFKVFQGLVNPDAQIGVRRRGLLSDVNKYCDCSGGTCGCCGNAEYMGVSMKTCLNISPIPEKYAFKIAVKMGFMNVFNTELSAKKLEQACFQLPLFKQKIEACLTSQMNKLEGENNFRSCMQFEVKGYGSTLLYMNFNCLRYENKVLSMEANEGENKDATVSIDTPNPIQAIIDFVKKIKANEK